MEEPFVLVLFELVTQRSFRDSQSLDGRLARTADSGQRFKDVLALQVTDAVGSGRIATAPTLCFWRCFAARLQRGVQSTGYIHLHGSGVQDLLHEPLQLFHGF